MSPILLSFLCGAAFIGGAVAVTVLVCLADTIKTRKDRDELFGYWRDLSEKHATQNAILERIAAVMERQKRE